MVDGQWVILSDMQREVLAWKSRFSPGDQGETMQTLEIRCCPGCGVREGHFHLENCPILEDNRESALLRERLEHINLYRIAARRRLMW